MSYLCRELIYSTRKIFCLKVLLFLSLDKILKGVFFDFYSLKIIFSKKDRFFFCSYKKYEYICSGWDKPWLILSFRVYLVRVLHCCVIYNGGSYHKEHWYMWWCGRIVLKQQKSNKSKFNFSESMPKRFGILFYFYFKTLHSLFEICSLLKKSLKTNIIL